MSHFQKCESGTAIPEGCYIWQSGTHALTGQHSGASSGGVNVVALSRGQKSRRADPVSCQWPHLVAQLEQCRTAPLGHEDNGKLVGRPAQLPSRPRYKDSKLDHPKVFIICGWLRYRKEPVLLLQSYKISITLGNNRITGRSPDEDPIQMES